jgi:hypothetical protein
MPNRIDIPIRIMPPQRLEMAIEIDDEVKLLAEIP